jgi:hypothetical protein
VKGFGGRALGNPTFHVLPFTVLKSEARTPLADLFSSPLGREQVLYRYPNGAEPRISSSLWTEDLNRLIHPPPGKSQNRTALDGPKTAHRFGLQGLHYRDGVTRDKREE